MMIMMVHPSPTPADEHTRSKRERGKKIISTRTIPPSSALLPWIDTWRLAQRVSIIQYPEILPLRSTPKANISRPSKYIPYISHAHPIHLSLRKEEDQRTIITTTTNDRSIHAQKAYLPSTSPIKIHPNPIQIMLPSLPLPLFLLLLLLPSLHTTAQKLPLDSTSHNHIQISLRPYKSNSCTNPSRRGSGKSHSITLKANHRADILSSSGIKIGEITHSKCVGFPRGGFNSFVFDGEGLYGIADGNGEGEGNGEGGVVKVKEKMGRCRVDVFPNRLCLGDVMGGLGEVCTFSFSFFFSFLIFLFVRSFD